jgi:murein L,D-transpeptidase YafK
MRLNVLSDSFISRLQSALFVVLATGILAACGSLPEIPAAEAPLSQETTMLLGKKGMNPTAPIFVRIFKEESELEVWKARDDGRFYHFKTYPICNWSGDLGPKEATGDRQAPEGFYSISQTQMNPNSKFYLAFNLGYPNAYDRSWNRTGEALMVHGKCKSAGCYAMTDALAEEIYALARESFRGGQTSFDVHAFPFRMTDEKLARFEKHKWYAFWRTLKEGYEYFEVNRVPPSIAVCERRYVVNVVPPAYGRLDPAGRCPRFQRPVLQPFAPKPMEGTVAFQKVTVPGPKTRSPAEVEAAANLAQQMQTATGSTPMPTASALGFNQ